MTHAHVEAERNIKNAAGHEKRLNETTDGHR